MRIGRHSRIECKALNSRHKSRKHLLHSLERSAIEVGGISEGEKEKDLMNNLQLYCNGGSGDEVVEKRVCHSVSYLINSWIILVKLLNI